MAPLPPTPKITEISAISAADLVPFVEGWENVNCPVEVNGGVDFYATLMIKGENLTDEWLRQVIKGAYYNGGSDNEATVSVLANEEDGEAFVDFTFNFPFGDGDRVQFDIDGVKSAWMTMYKAN